MKAIVAAALFSAGVAAGLSLAPLWRALPPTALAGDSDRNFVGCGKITYAECEVGSVVFEHTMHMKNGLACRDCHPDLFSRCAGGSGMTMGDMYQGKWCGTCHRKGGSAFDAATNCGRCHKK